MAALIGMVTLFLINSYSNGKASHLRSAPEIVAMYDREHLVGYLAGRPDAESVLVTQGRKTVVVKGRRRRVRDRVPEQVKVFRLWGNHVSEHTRVVIRGTS
jgi:hypothetical protein